MGNGKNDPVEIKMTLVIVNGWKYAKEREVTGTRAAGMSRLQTVDRSGYHLQP